MPLPRKIHAFGDDALGTQDAVGIAQALQRGEVSPGELIAAAIARAEKVNPILRGIATEDFDRATQQALAPPAGPFSGVPTWIKDNTPVMGLPTTFGSAAVQSPPAPKHGAVARQVLAQGFINLGKSTMPEFGFNATTEFAHQLPTRNPWHTDYSAGASSGGAAVLVAAGVVPIAHANDGGGSIRIPAACCGLVGLKPSRGRLANGELARTLPVNIISDGVITRTVRDTAAFYAHAERHRHARGLPPIGNVRHPGEQRLRIGLVTDSINGTVTDAPTREAVENTAQQLQILGHEVDLLPLPADQRFPEDFARYWAMLAFMVRTCGSKVIDASFDKERLDNLTRGLDQKFRREMHKLPGTLWRLKRSAQVFARQFADYDAMLSPVVGHTTPQLGHLNPNLPFEGLFERLMNFACFTPLANATGAPAISLPLGQTEAGLPIGVQLMAHQGQERLLLELAFELEEAVGWKRMDE